MTGTAITFLDCIQNTKRFLINYHHLLHLGDLKGM